MIVPADQASWARLRTQTLDRDGHRCRNCASNKYLEVHHWQPLPHETLGIDREGYSTGDRPLVVPLSGLITLCQVCHNALTAARQIVRLSENSELLPDMPVSETGPHNIFQLWMKTGRTVPIKVVRDHWDPNTGNYMLVERVEIRKWPYGFAWGRYFKNGVAGEEAKISSAGTYNWKLADPQDV